MPVSSLPRLIFMGTSSFAVPSLELLLVSGYPVLAVVTAPDKLQGRGRKIVPSPVEVLASQHQIPILKPVNLKDLAFVDCLSTYQAEIYVVVAFRMLPKVIWSQPRLGTLNLHASYLPAYRGAAPIHWALIQGETWTGITTFLIEQTIDTGCIVLQERVRIYQVDTTGSLSERLERQGAHLLVRSVQALSTGSYTLIPQSMEGDALDKKAPKIYTEDCQINWQQPTERVFNFIRGLSPYPGAWMVLNALPIKIKEAYPIPIPFATPGTICSDNKTYIYVATQDGAIAIDVLQPAGKKDMSCRAFLSGYSVNT